jgi:hypothetical protein
MNLRHQSRGLVRAQLGAAGARIAALALLLLTSACVGQSGAEGTSEPKPNVPTPGLPGPGTSCAEPEVEALTFDPAWIEDLANGRHETTFHWGEFGTEATAMPLGFEVRQRSESKTTTECGGVSAFNVDVVVEMPGERTATFKGYVQGSPRGAFISATASTTVRSALGVPGLALSGEDHPGYRVFAHIDDDGVSGKLAFTSGSTGECTAASWPADRSCPLFQREEQADTRFGDFSFSELRARLTGHEHSVRWNDGSSAALKLSVESEDSPVCVGSLFGDLQPDGTRPDRLSQVVRLRLNTSDQRLDVVVPAMLTILWSEKGVVSAAADQFTTFQLSASAIGHFAKADDGDFDTLELNAGFSAEAISGSISLGSVALRNPPASLDKASSVESLRNGECWGISQTHEGNATYAGTLE